ncbi:ABC transporter substrate binding protein [Geothrix fermentans]|jgi:ABC-type uncharacterized transport system substrate-binding protein|uniref:ABC transporter substrate binding protein n=1 Tax=Geothrix fermentans TaxID=44676 RepID=UPI0012F8BBC3|nr:ABC transporter substrate binding protein [Geothrix fermentans]
MARFRTLVLAPALVSMSLAAGDYDALIGVMGKAWPSVKTIAVVCDATSNKRAVAALTASAEGFRVLVVDVKGPQDMGKAVAALSGRKPDAVVLLAGDHVAGDGTAAASFIIQRMAVQKIPTVATTEAGVKQGAVLAIGPGTGGKLMANVKVASVVGVPVPPGAITL